MTNSLVLKAASLINSGDIAGAEYALATLVETEGDHALVEVLDEMPPKDLLAVIREFDSSKESVVNLLVTPEQFARAVVMERLYGDHTHSHLRGMINSVIYRDDSKTSEFIGAIGEVDGGCEALIDYLSDRDEEVIHFSKYSTFNYHHNEENDVVDKSECSDNDWRELTWYLKYEHADMFEQILPVLKTRLAQRLHREAEQEREEQRRLLELDQPPSVAAEAPGKKGSTDSVEESAL